jgi:crotonobetainyl-CoA:carnitine CoA-transferase CaiB-like acyl-CoA transferase
MWGRGKQLLALDLRVNEECRIAQERAAEADVVIVGLRPRVSAEFGLDYSTLSRPEQVYCEISGFGPLRSYDDRYRAYDAVVAARSGRFMGNDALSGARQGAPPDAPIFLVPPVASFAAAMLAVEGVAAALYKREASGRGDCISTSLLEGLTAATMRLRLERDADGGIRSMVPGRDDLRYQGIVLTFATVECKDGRFIQMCARQDTHFRNWLMALGLQSVLKEPRFKDAPLGFRSAEDIAVLERTIREEMRKRDQAEWLERFETYDVPADPFLKPAEFLSHPQTLANGGCVEITNAEMELVRQPGPLAAFSRTPALLQSSVSSEPPGSGRGRLSQRARGALWEPCTSPAGERRTHEPPLADVTILEFGGFLAGPLTTTLLAELGARVIKVEPLDGDPYRRVGLEYVHVGHGKESIALDLRRPEAKLVLQRLVRLSDAVTHNFRPGVAERLGMDYESVVALKPDIVYLFAAGYGSRGPLASRAAFHSTPNALSGAGIAQAGVDNDPVDDSYPDPCAALAAAASLAMGLLARRRFGFGQYIETSMIRSGSYVNSDALTMTDDDPPMTMNDSRQLGLSAVWRIYRCCDGWLFIGAAQDKEWRRLADALGHPDWLRDERFLTPQARREHSDVLAGMLEEQFRGQTVAALEESLCQAGVPAARADEQTFEAFLYTQGLLTQSEDTEFGEYWRLPHRIRSSAWTVSGRPSPRLGENTHDLLRELGLTDEEVTSLAEGGVVR